MGEHVVPRFCNLDLVSLHQHMFFLDLGKVEQSGEDHAIKRAANQALGEVGNSLGGRQ